MRSDGTRVKNEDPMYYLIPHFLTKRYDAMNMVTLDIPEAPMRAYMNQKRREGKKVSHLALFLTAYLRTMEEYPALNRFISGNKKIFQHNDISVSMVVLKPGGDDTMSKIYLQPGEDVFSVQEKVTSYISTNKNEGENNVLDKWMRRLCSLSGLLGFAAWLIRTLDKYGMLPKALIEASPFHASLLVSNLASIRANHIYHHIYQFGTTSMSVTMGNLRDVPHRSRDGGVTLERCLPLGVVMDERIANGHYLNLAFARLKQYLANPVLLERGAAAPAPAEEAAKDAD